MPADQRPPGRREAALLLAGAAYALGAAATSAFTWPADIVTAIPIVVLAVLVVVRWPRRPLPLPLPEPGPGSVSLEAGLAHRGRHPFRAWVVLFAAVVVWELAGYLARGSRGAHPTLSSMTDALDRFHALKALVFFGWLCLGAWIVRRGMRAFPAAAGPVGPVGPVGPHDLPGPTEVR